MHSAPAGQAPAGASNATLAVPSDPGATIDGGSDVLPITTISGSDCGAAGKPPGGKKKLAFSRMSSEIRVQLLCAQPIAVVVQTLLPRHTNANSLFGSESDPVESGRCVQ